MISASIVLYNQNTEILKKTVDSFLNTPIKKKLFLIDNSHSNRLESYFSNPEIEYFFIGKNIGFGRAHNLVIEKIESNYHLILNPDVEFNSDVIVKLIDELKRNEENISFITPKVVYPDKSFQFVCRKHPSFLDLLNRKINFSSKYLQRNEYRERDLKKSFSPDFIQGCFMLFKTKHFKELNGFDTRYFLYMEDADICRRIQSNGNKILYYPSVSIIHQHQRDSSKNIKLFFIHIISAFKYFLKWGF